MFQEWIRWCIDCCMSRVLALSQSTAYRAQSLILACEFCSSEAEMPFDWLLDEVTGSDGSDVDYILSEPARCPRCRGEVTEKTLVEWGVEIHG